MKTLLTKDIIQDFYRGDFDWDQINEINRAISYELYWGPLGPNYWKKADPLQHYNWTSLSKACEDLRILLDGLPSKVYFDPDSEIIYETDPWNNVMFWIHDGDTYIGPCDYFDISPYELVLNKSVFNAVF